MPPIQYYYRLHARFCVRLYLASSSGICHTTASLPSPPSSNAITMKYNMIKNATEIKIKYAKSVKRRSQICYAVP